MFPYSPHHIITPALKRPRWSLKQTADATVEPVLVGDIKNHLRVLSGAFGGTVALAAAPTGVSRASGVVTVTPAAGQALPGLGQTVTLAGITDVSFNGSDVNGSGYVVQSVDTQNGHFTINQPGANATSGAGTYQITKADDEDTIIAIAKAARRRAEQETQRALVKQTWRLQLDHFPYFRQRTYPVGYLPIILPRPPLISVTSLKYMDPNDSTGATLISLVSGTDFFVDSDSEPARVAPLGGKAWPGALQQIGSVQLTYDCGYGIDGTSVPEDIKMAIKQLCGHWYENRESVDMTGHAAPLPQAAAWLLEPYCVKWDWE